MSARTERISRLTSFPGSANYTVGDCLVWNRQGEQQQLSRSITDIHYNRSEPASAGTYRSVLVHGKRDVDGDPWDRQTPGSAGRQLLRRDTAGEAIRGWPRYLTPLVRSDSNERADGAPDGQSYDDDDRRQRDHQQPESDAGEEKPSRGNSAGSSKQKKKPKNKKTQTEDITVVRRRVTTASSSGSAKKKGVKLSTSNKNRLRKTVVESETNMSDLMTQRYRAQYLRDKEEEEERKRERQAERDRDIREGRRTNRERRSVAATRSSQLRAISNAERIATDHETDLWKMNRFKEAKAQISTFRKSTFGSGGGGFDGKLWGSSRGAAGNIGWIDRKRVYNDYQAQKPDVDNDGEREEFENNEEGVPEAEPSGESFDDGGGVEEAAPEPVPEPEALPPPEVAENVYKVERESFNGYSDMLAAL